MDFGALEVQIFVGLALVLGTVFVSLVCDFLKGNNETLRERNIELAVRQEERERWERLNRAGDQTGGDSRRRAGVTPGEVPVAYVTEPVAQPAEAWATKEELERVERLAESIRKQAVSKPPAEAVPDTVTAAAEPGGTSAASSAEKSVLPPATEQPAEVADSETVLEGRGEDLPPFSVHTKVTPIDVIATEHAAASETIHVTADPERLAELAESAILGDDPAAEVKELDESDLVVSEEYEAAASPVEGEAAGEDVRPGTDADETTSVVEEREETEAEPAGATSLVLPTGFQDFSSLSDALVSNEPFSGTIVVVGVGRSKGLSGGKPAGEEAVSIAETTDLIQSLTRPTDFACQTSSDEYLLIFPGETGSEAQHRLQYVSQCLWDFQIRSVGSSPVMFSWGAVEVAGEPLGETIDSARERMRQTKRDRERAPRQIHHYPLHAAGN